MISYLLLASALIGPPSPVRQDQTISAYDQRIRDLENKLEEVDKTADGTLFDASIIGLCSSFDIWATERCISRNPGCYEGNEGGKDSGTQRLALKAGVYPIKVGGVYLLRRLGHHNWARGAAIGISLIDTAFGIHALNKSKGK